MAECVLNDREGTCSREENKSRSADHLLPSMKKHARDLESLKNDLSKMMKELVRNLAKTHERNECCRVSPVA